MAADKTAADVKTGKHGRAIFKGGRGTATRTVGLLGGILSFAVKEELRPDNPAEGVQRFKDGKNTQYLSEPELQRLGEVLDECDTVLEQFTSSHHEWVTGTREGEPARPPTGVASPVPTNALRLLVLTGARRSEIVNLRWEDIDFEHGYPRVPNLLVPVLEALDSLGGSASNDEINDRVAEVMALPPEVRAYIHKDGPLPKVDYRCAWARSWLKNANLVENSECGVWTLTGEGRTALDHHPSGLNGIGFAGASMM